MRARAFTLVEMMIVVLLLAISAALAVPRAGSTASSRLSAAARQLAADLAYAQVESIAHSDDLRLVVFEPANNRYFLAVASDVTTPITHPVSKQAYAVTFGGAGAHELTGVTINALSVGGDDQLKFGAYGQLDQATAATITLGCAGKTITITIDPTPGEAATGAVK